MNTTETLRNARAVDEIKRETETLEPSAHATADAVEHAAGRIAKTAAWIAGGEYRPAYNGHVNRETWNTSLWMDNDPGTYSESLAIVRRAFAEYTTPQLLADVMADRPADERARQERSGAIGDAADALREWWDELYAPADTAGPVSDAWTYALACVDWRAIADSIAEGHSIAVGTAEDDEETDED